MIAARHPQVIPTFIFVVLFCFLYQKSYVQQIEFVHIYMGFFYLLAKLYPKPPIENLSACIEKRSICPMTAF